MTSTIISRAWSGEAPYIKSWANYYLETLGFDRILIIRCDEEKFDFLDDRRIDFVDHQASDEQSILNALLQVEMPRSDYVFSCDIDEYLILHGDDIKSFLQKNPQDSHFFRWAINCSVEAGVKDLRDNLRLGCSVGHDGKSMFRTNMMDSIINEHRVKMKHGCSHKEWETEFTKNPYIIHFCSRGIEDLIIRSLWQGIKIEPNKEKYATCFRKPPTRFADFPIRFKIAYFQQNLEKVPTICDLPLLGVDQNKLDLIFAKTGFERFTDLFNKKYRINRLLRMYPKINFYDVTTDSDIRLL